jgi:hypothetical protein
MSVPVCLLMSLTLLVCRRGSVRHWHRFADVAAAIIPAGWPWIWR